MIPERQAEIDALVAVHFPSKTEKDQGKLPAGTTAPTSDLIERATKAKNGEKFARLFAGKWEGEYGSQSEADLALCSRLAFWTGKNAAQIDSLFRDSGLFRPKWDDVHFGDGQTYGQETVARAIAGSSDLQGLAGVNELINDPHRVARLLLGTRFEHPDRSALLFWREEFYERSVSSWKPLREATVRGEISRVAKPFFDRKNREAVAEWVANDGCDPETGRKVRKPTCRTVTVSLTSNVRQALSGMVPVADAVEPPAWLGDANGRPDPAEIVAFENVLVHIPTFASGGTSFSMAHTPLLFSLNAMNFPFDPNAPIPEAWMTFVKQLWPGDPRCIRELMKWFGYCLTADTSQQKILMLIGPPRSGKGTIARILTALLGAANVAGPTLSSLATNFGLWPLLGKTLAVISDARITGRTDSAPIIERLLSISGEDVLTVDRKHLPPVSTKLKTRLMILSNELPRLGDSSAALASRMVVLGMSRGWLGQEDPGLTARLASEAPGILVHFALPGWKMLQEDGCFRQPPSGAELAEEMESLSSPILSFVEERCVLDPAAWVDVQVLFTEWLHWCETMHREKPGDRQAFGRDLRAALPHLRIERPHRGKERVRVYEGIRLRLPGEEWSAMVRGHFYSTRRQDQDSPLLHTRIEDAIERTADHRGPLPDDKERSRRDTSAGRFGYGPENPCRSCFGTDFWANQAGNPVCRRCHPPVREVAS
jgi:P4 family phage/plasmid primase-like protien